MPAKKRPAAGVQPGKGINVRRSKKTADVQALKGFALNRCRDSELESLLSSAEQTAEALFGEAKQLGETKGSPEECELLQRMLGDAAMLRNRCREARAAIEREDMVRLAIALYWIGSLTEIIKVRPYEHYVQVGRTLLEKQNRGGSPRKLSADDRPAVKAAVDELIRNGTEPTKAWRLVGTQYDVSHSTIRRACIG